MRIEKKTKTGNVLVVEDDTSAREHLLGILRSHYSVYAAMDGPQALDLLKTIPIDTVTVDPYLPGLHGEELLSRIRETNPRVRIIIVTGDPLSKGFDDNVREQVFDFVPRPFQRHVLLRSVREAMARREAQSV